MDWDQVNDPNEHKEIQGTILFGNKTKVPLDYINGLSAGDVKVYPREDKHY